MLYEQTVEEQGSAAIGAICTETKYPRFASVVTTCVLIVERATAENQFARIGGRMSPRPSVTVSDGDRMSPIHESRWETHRICENTFRILLTGRFHARS